MMNITEVLNNRIEERGMTITTVATRANMSPELLSRTLKGHRKLKADELVDICCVLGLSLNDFVRKVTTVNRQQAEANLTAGLYEGKAKKEKTTKQFETGGHHHAARSI